jgi:hypothetical protein
MSGTNDVLKFESRSRPTGAMVAASHSPRCRPALVIFRQRHARDRHPVAARREPLEQRLDATANLSLEFHNEAHEPTISQDLAWIHRTTRECWESRRLEKAEGSSG